MSSRLSMRRTEVLRYEMGVGLAFFLGAVGFLVFREFQNVAVVSLISGALIEVISGINFYSYGKTSVELADFQTRLDVTQRLLLANSICESVEGDYKQKARSELIQTIAGVNTTRDAPGSSGQGT